MWKRRLTTLKKIEDVNNITDDSNLVSLDVRSLYTNIPYTEGIEVVQIF